MAVWQHNLYASDRISVLISNKNIVFKFKFTKPTDTITLNSVRILSTPPPQ